ncbi:MAG: TIR domain-containing protein [Rhodospirillales bacterium]|nr:TIR domain-containing protein [Rhodospirillales bacterium]
MPRVFLSHSSSDKLLVTRLADDLKAEGIGVWLDDDEILPGDSIAQNIQLGLDDSDLLVLVLSRKSVRSGWVEKEWQAHIADEATSRKVHIVPVLIEDCDIPRLLRDKSHADFRDDYDAGLTKLLTAIRKHVGAPTAGARIRRPPYHARLVVESKDGAPMGRWHAPPFELALPLDGKGLEELRWYLETYPQFPGAGDRVRAKGLESCLSRWGGELFEALFDNRTGGEVHGDLAKAVAHGRPVLLTLASDDAEVLGQPWEMLRDAEDRPLTFQGVSLRRQLRESGETRTPELGLPLRVLSIVSRPTDTGFLDPRDSIAPMLDALEALGPGQLDLEFCEPPTFGQLEKQVSEARKNGKPFHIVHFDGHGTYLPRTGVGALAFEDGAATTDLIAGPRLGDLMVRQGVPLVLLEACRSADLADRPVFGSVAPALLNSGVGSVVAFSHSVHVEAARLLVERFYGELAAGMSVGEALAEARRALHANRARWLHLGPEAETVNLDDWFIPQLYQVGDDPALTAGAAAEPEREWARTGVAARLHGFPPPPVYRFHGRARELLALERQVRDHPAVLLHAMGGMGKTALAREAAAWWLRAGRFEAAVFVSFEQWAGADQVAQRIGAALGDEGFAALPQEEQWRQAVALFRTRRVLLVWDNFESTLPAFQEGEEAADGGTDGLGVYTAEARQGLARLYRDLTDGAPLGRLLVTCRPEETELPAIKEVALEGLARPDSLHLLAAVLDAKSIDTGRPGYERERVERLLDALADHPLSIALVAPHLKARTPDRIREEFGEPLEEFADAAAAEGRNRSLLASLAFSKRRLSEAAQAALPYLAWFRGGVFEGLFIIFAELDPEAWEATRAELVATALVRVETVEVFSTPFLRFHPTLPHAARAADVADPEATEKRFIGVYLADMRATDKALRGGQPAAAMLSMSLEEANYRAAIRRAFRRGGRSEGQALAGTLRTFLQMAGRPRERDEVVAWVRERMPVDETLDGAACAAIRDHAWSRFTQGHGDEAIATLEDLIRRLADEGLADSADPALQLALSQLYLGRLLDSHGRPDRALEPLGRAIAQFEGLGEAQRGNLAAALGDLANALMELGRFDEALEASERGLAIRRDLGHDLEVAAGLGRAATILTRLQRYAEADARYTEALAAARDAGDLELQGTFLQHQGILHGAQGRFDRAVALYQQALEFFRRADDAGGEMQTADLLANAEAQRGQLDVAEAWYGRARELAKRLNDRRQLAANAHNVGILHQNRAEQTKDPGEREAWLRRAVDSIRESLAIVLEMNDRPGAAKSHFQLGVLHRMLGELDEAERNARESLAICESLRLPDVYMDYGNLAKIARARGDTAAAAEWQAKHDTKVEEIGRLRRGGGEDGAVPDDLVKAILALAQAAFQARGGGALPPDAAEALARLADYPAPLDAVGAFLRAVADGKPPPPVPGALPAKLREILDALAESIRDGDPDR